MIKKLETSQSSTLLQLVFTFIVPLFILMRFSAESQLGPTKSLLLALAFPVVYEMYSVKKRGKLSMLSVFAIAGILITGAISLLGLSENWLAVRRSVPYLVVAAAILVSMWIKRPLLNLLLPQIVDMKKVTEHTDKNRHMLPELQRLLDRASYMLAALLLVITVVSYVLTKIVIMSHTDTAAFNQEYAHLRVISLPAITLPMIIGLGTIITYLILKIEKLTGIEFEELLKKKK